MDFFSSLKQGVIGLLLFAGNWILPADDTAALIIESEKKSAPVVWQVSLNLKISLHQQMEQLIDAGVPLNFRYSVYSDKGDTISFVRSLTCNVADLTYTFCDSLPTGPRCSRPYGLLLLALNDFCRWECALNPNAASCQAEAKILSSRVSQLNRSVDMSRIWGHETIAATIALAQKKK
jgi:hypothetical protein